MDRLTEEEAALLLKLLPPSGWGIVAELVSKASYPYAMCNDVVKIQNLLVDLEESKAWPVKMDSNPPVPTVS